LGVMLMLAETKPVFGELKVLMDIMALHRREVSLMFIFLVLLLTIIQIFLLNREKEIKKTHLLFIFLALLFFSLSYPFLSKDMFSYLFSAKTLYFYRQNPYATTPNVFIDQDLWLTFTHWVHRKYVYGPVYLAYSLIPMLLFSAKRFLLNYLGLKVLNLICFLLSGVILGKMLKNKYLVWPLWFFNPLLILELLVNSHNDVVMLFLFYLSLYVFNKKRMLSGMIIFIASILTKFVSSVMLPVFVLKGKWRDYFFELTFWSFLGYLLFRLPDMQVWYFVWLYFLLPFLNFSKTVWITLFVFQMLLVVYKYYSFVLTGMWVTLPEVKILLPIIYILPAVAFTLSVFRRTIKK
jgi:hypothetical protein